MKKKIVGGGMFTAAVGFRMVSIGGITGEAVSPVLASFSIVGCGPSEVINLYCQD